MEASSKEEAQRLWQQERDHRHDTLRRQKREMAEDEQWLEKEERLLVRNRAPSSSSSSSLAGVDRLSLSLVFHPPRSREPSRSRRPASFTLCYPPVSLPSRGSKIVFCNSRLPVLLQDPMGPEEGPPTAVGTHEQSRPGPLPAP